MSAPQPKLDELVIRPSTQGDKEGIHRLYKRTREVHALSQDGPGIPEDLQHIKRDYLNKGGLFLVGTVDDQIVSFGALKPTGNPGEAQITRLRINPHYEGQGFSAMMVNALHAAGKISGYDNVKDMTVRQYKDSPTLQAAIFDLHTRTKHETNEPITDAAFKEEVHRIPENYLGNRGEFLLGEIDGRLVSMVGLINDGTRLAEVKRMRVDPEFRRLGLAKRMMKRIHIRARELGYRFLELTTTNTQSQDGARALYKSLGYVPFEKEKYRDSDFKIITFSYTVPSRASRRESLVGGHVADRDPEVVYSLPPDAHSRLVVVPSHSSAKMVRFAEKVRTA